MASTIPECFSSGYLQVENDKLVVKNGRIEESSEYIATLASDDIYDVI